MKILTSPLSNVFPAAQGIIRTRLKNLTNNRLIPGKLEPLPVAEYKGNFVLGNGHHRAFLTYLTSKLYNVNIEVPLAVVENNQDILNYFEGAFQLMSVDSFILTYECNRKRRGFPANIEQLRYEKTLKHPGRAIELRGRIIYAESLPPRFTEEEIIGEIPSIDALLSAYGLPLRESA